ncbi:MAG: sigma-70 family RNA polymerase sigma factor [Bacteroidales bacterium]|jgi:RNA polymerase sigma-70 factor (ECF subfamily)|nr:sigma-70 family RNA polymerase sigma factor [Bacteroidales bacterium]
MKDFIAIRIKNGDEQAFELLFRKYYSRLKGFANKFLHNQEEAEEIVEEVFIKIWENKKSIDPDSSLVSYMFKTAQNLSLNALRKNKTVSKHIEILKAEYIDNVYFYTYEDYNIYELEVLLLFLQEKTAGMAISSKIASKFFLFIFRIL